MIFYTDWALSQPAREGSDEHIDISVTDAQEVARCLQDRKLLRQLSDVQAQQIENLKREVELLQKESELKDRIIALKDMEIAVQKRVFNDMKEVSDRALKLAEISKPKSNWQLQGLLGMAAFVIGVLVAK